MGSEGGHDTLDVIFTLRHMADKVRHMGSGNIGFRV